MINIEDKTKCCGCTACANICPKNCIKMVEDEEGFVYPKVDKAKCIECNLCESVCPMESIFPKEENKLECETYAFQILDEKILKYSASGGFFYELSKYVLSKNGYVCGAIYDKNFEVVHYITNNLNEIKYFSGSKYVQSNLNSIFKELKKFLDSGVLVCFSGTVCQVNGLKKYLRKGYKNLITVDLVCAGVPSPKLWKEYRNYQQIVHNSEIKSVNFRNKTYGYSNSTMKIEFKNGNIYSKSGRIDPMMYLFVNGFVKRPACYSCPFKGLERNSDFTIFDSWSAEKILNIKLDNKGWTSVIVHSKNAKEILKNFKEESLKKIDADKIIKSDGRMIYMLPKYPKQREMFYKDLNNHNFNYCINKYVKVSVKDIFFEEIKPILFKCGVIYHIKNIKKVLRKTLNSK